MLYYSWKDGVYVAKILGSFSGMRKYLEKEMLADSLQGRVRYGCTTYVGMDGDCVIKLCIDGKQVKRFSMETIHTYFIKNGLTENKNPYGIREYWEEFWPLSEKYPMESRTEYGDHEFCDALKIYRNQDIQASISSENPLVRMFAVLDRRIGKRTLEKLKETVDSQPAWLAKIYRLRLDAEKI